MVGDHMSRYSAWSNTIQKVCARLSKRKVNTLSIGGRLTLLKSVLGAVPIYNMSLFKAPKSVLHEMGRLRNNFLNDEISVAAKCGAPSFDDSFRRQVRDGVERNQWSELLSLLGMISLSPLSDMYFCDLNGDGVFRVKDIRSVLDRHPTRGNLISRGVTMDSPLCPICELTLEDSSHLFFSCDLGKSISQRIFRWWNIQWEEVSSFVDWYTWFGSIHLPSKLKAILEGVYYTAWWHIWSFGNRKCSFVGYSPSFIVNGCYNLHDDAYLMSLI
nr:RNA-directed DNA polymerase, eukaryota [Tanacetum cinerariifolium]